jgi:hypothetical protein
MNFLGQSNNKSTSATKVDGNQPETGADPDENPEKPSGDLPDPNALAKPAEVITGAYLTVACGPVLDSTGKQVLAIGCSALNPDISLQNMTISAFDRSPGQQDTPVSASAGNADQIKWQLVFENPTAVDSADHEFVLVKSADAKALEVFVGDMAKIRKGSEISKLSNQRVSSGIIADYYVFGPALIKPPSNAIDQQVSFTGMTPTGQLTLTALDYYYSNLGDKDLNDHSELPLNEFGLQVETYLYMPHDCPECEFDLNTDDASFAYLDGELFLSNGGGHGINHGFDDFSTPAPPLTLIQKKAALTTGFHKLEIRYLQNTQSSALFLSWRENSSKSFNPIPASNYFTPASVESFLEADSLAKKAISQPPAPVE